MQFAPQCILWLVSDQPESQSLTKASQSKKVLHFCFSACCAGKEGLVTGLQNRGEGCLERVPVEGGEIPLASVPSSTKRPQRSANAVGSSPAEIHPSFWTGAQRPCTVSRER